MIATPVTIVSALTSAARHGVLIKGGEYVESFGATCAMAFDKTGTLTLGRLEVTDVITLSDVSSDEVLRLAAAVETRSEHPIARAIVRHAAGRKGDPSSVDVDGFRAHTGLGVEAQVGETRVVVGTMELLHAVGFSKERTGAVSERMLEAEREGKTVVAVALDGGVAGLIALSDQIRPEAPAVLARLRDMGVHHQILITGDQAYSAQAIGKLVRADEIHASLRPAEKVEAVRTIGRLHEGVAMLGDGVNDAPALAAASVGVAMGGAGSPATIETADVVLMADDLNMLPYARRVSQMARRLVRVNIGLALGLKLALAVGAVTGFVSLIVAVLVGDMGASLAVTLNAMRLARVRPYTRDG